MDKSAAKAGKKKAGVKAHHLRDLVLELVILQSFILLPISDQELQVLKRRMAFPLRATVGLPLLRVSDPSVLSEQRQVLQVVLLDAVLDVVDLVARDQRGETEDACGEHLRQPRVEHALRIHEQHTAITGDLLKIDP